MILLPGEFLPRQEIPLWADGPKEFWAEREVLKDPRVNHWDEGLSPWQRRFYQIFDKGWFNAMCFKWGEALTVYLCNLKCTKPSMAFVQTVGTPLRTLAKAPDPIGAAARRQLSRGVHGLAEYETEVWLPWVKRTCRCSLHEVVMWLWRLSWSCKLYGYNVCSGETKKNKGSPSTNKCSTKSGRCTTFIPRRPSTGTFGSFRYTRSG